MRVLMLSLLVLATGCATTGKTAAQRAAEIERYRQEKAAEQAAREEAARQEAATRQEAAPTDQTSPTAPVTPTPPATPTPPTSPATAGVPAAPAAPVGPRTGLFGIRAALLGSNLALGESAGSSSTVGFRYFMSDSVGVNLDAGFAYASVGDNDIIGLALGVGLNVLGGTEGAPLRPFFALEGSITQVGSGDSSATLMTAAVGGGAEYWLAPQLSVSASLLVGLAAQPNTDAIILGTFRPGLGVTLYTN